MGCPPAPPGVPWAVVARGTLRLAGADAVGRTRPCAPPCPAGPLARTPLLARGASGIGRPAPGLRLVPRAGDRGGAPGPAGHVQPLAVGGGAERLRLWTPGAR